MIQRLFFLGICFVALSFSSCKYSLKGISIDPNANTFSVDNFDLKVANARPILGQVFTEGLIDKIRRETRLDYTNDKPDYEFLGSIIRYEVEAVAPQAGERTALNRLHVTAKVEFVDHLDEEGSWENNFQYFFDFPSTTNLFDVEDQAIENINEQLLEDIFRKAFTNW